MISRIRRSIQLSRSLKEVENEIASWPAWIRAGMGDAETLRKVYMDVGRHSSATSRKVSNATYKMTVRKNEQVKRTPKHLG